MLERISIRGVTSTQNFALAFASQPMPLQTRYRAVVDGTSGDTLIEEVDAVLGRSRIVAKGSVAAAPGAKGRTVSLDVRVDEGRFEDFLRLTVKGTRPPMSGTIQLRSRFELPPGKDDVVTRMRLAGRFAIANARFTSDAAQDRIDTLSRKGRGEPSNVDVRNVLSAFGGEFVVRHGVLDLPRFQFHVRGSTVDLGGSYQLQASTLDFVGTLTLDAPLSRTTTGFRSLLRAIDPLFRTRTAGSSIPIWIRGAVSQPSFGFDVRRIFPRGAPEKNQSTSIAPDR